ncbi:hypothetical protein GBA52_018222 [Prunus armeniaca]|nr:hypothetical protein GBA52_018222 [Prunus armeniaca]
MRWTSPEVKSDIPVPRDSHSSLAIGKKLLVYGGDRGDRYYGGVDVFDMDTLTWSRFGCSRIFTWCQGWPCSCDCRDKGKILTSAVYGGCGEDERPLNELLVLQLEQNTPMVVTIFPCAKFSEAIGTKRGEGSLKEQILTRYKSYCNNAIVLYIQKGEEPPVQKHGTSRDHQTELKREQHPHVSTGRPIMQYPAVEQKTYEAVPVQNLIGARFKAKLMEHFDSGELGSSQECQLVAQSTSSSTSQIPIAIAHQPFPNPNRTEPPLKLSEQPMKNSMPGSGFRPQATSGGSTIFGHSSHFILSQRKQP